MISNLLPRVRRRQLLLFLIPAAAAFIAACGTGNPQDTFNTAGPVAERQASLFKYILSIAVVVFILVEGGIIFITLKYRRKSDSEMPKQTHGNTRLEITWTIIPALILIAVAVPTINTIWDLKAPPSDEPVMTIEAIGHQWWFEFRYPGQEIITANELHVPVGTNVAVNLESQDVIHSFWVPNLFGKVDMVPTRENRLWFRADEPGSFYGQCAEFCGISHGLMRFRVIAEPQDKFDEWVAGMRRPPVAPAAGSPEERGQTVFNNNCSSCHAANSYRAGGYEQAITSQDNLWAGWVKATQDGDVPSVVSAPNLTHFGTRTTLAAGIRDLNKENLVEWIADPSSLKPGTRMQELAAVYNVNENHTASLEPSQISDLADFLLSLVPVEADVAPTRVAGDPVAIGQATFTSAGCGGCHSIGSDARTGPGLAGIAARAETRVQGQTADQYIEESIRNSTAFVVDGFQPIMPKFDGVLSNTEIEGLIAYLKTLN
jgi:cytochrome c oxidase subunit 2